jgi:hypothetical protein
MVIYFVLLIALIGLLVYAFAVNPKLGEVGHVMFWTGLLAFLMQVGTAHFVSILK